MEKADAFGAEVQQVRDPWKGITAAEMLMGRTDKRSPAPWESDSKPDVCTPRFRSDHLKTLCSGPSREDSIQRGFLRVQRRHHAAQRLNFWRGTSRAATVLCVYNPNM